jgi:putative endonuclease
MHYVYIIYSQSADRYYIGETNNIKARIEQHNNGQFKGSYTTIAKDWALYFKISCENIVIARKIEKHIKRMKSRKYLENLLLYKDISDKLLEKYSITSL